MVQIRRLSNEWLTGYDFLKNLHIKLLAVRRERERPGNYNSSPCTWYRRDTNEI